MNLVAHKRFLDKVLDRFINKKDTEKTIDNILEEAKSTKYKNLITTAYLLGQRDSILELDKEFEPIEIFPFQDWREKEYVKKDYIKYY